ncbi:MAG TPA: NADH-quinone oxidoreductase subunit NuoE family protein [Candidatus Azoamicus sp. MARI]
MNNLSNNFSKDILKKCDEWVLKFPKEQKKSAVIEILKIIQKENGGYLNEELIGYVANYLNIPKIFAYEVATFYSMFDLEKVGKYKIYLCMSISCMLCGSDDIHDYIKTKLNIDFNKTTADGKFTLKKAECLAACGGAPVMLIEEKYYENLTNSKIDSIIDKLE